MKGCGMFLAIFGATLTILVNPAYANSYANTISDGKCAVLDDVNGCSTPFKLSLPYKDQFTQSCNSHDVCYRCGKLYGWTQKDCDDGFLRKMKDTCLVSATTPSPNSAYEGYGLLSNYKGKLTSYVEFFKRLLDGYKDATKGGSKAEAQRVWDECKMILELFKQWTKSKDGVQSCQLGAEIYYRAVRAFGIYAYRHGNVKSFCNETCAKQLGNPL